MTKIFLRIINCLLGLTAIAAGWFFLFKAINLGEILACLFCFVSALVFLYLGLVAEEEDAINNDSGGGK